MRNKYFLILSMLASSLGFGQQYSYVKVDDTYSADRLVKEVLVNSTCDLVSNVRYQYGSGAPASNGIMAAGYFQRNGSTFPFESGIVLSTDKSSYVPGPKATFTPSANQFRWTGDQDLNDLINAAGGWPSVPDARSSIIDFEFIPVQNTISFDYIFASNSYYGCTWNCDNGALFGAWLIDMTTGIGQNLAVIPGTTNTPISINTLRDGTKTGMNCAGVSPNSQYFDNAYGGSGNLPALAAPVNYSGITVPMQSLTANVVVGRKYKIKLAIIDFCTNEAHTSGVFFNEGSFDIGNLDLGNPVLIADGNGLCVGESYTLQSGLDPLLFAFEWFKDGVKIPGATGATLTVTQTGNYSVKGLIPNIAGCVMESDPVLVEFYDYVSILPPKNLQLCPNAGLVTRFQLEDAVANVTNDPSILFAFYATQADANAEINEISNVYDLPNNTVGARTIWVRSYKANNKCDNVTSFTLSLTNCSIQLNVLSDLSICEGATVQTFDLTQQTPLVYNNAANFTVSYHRNNSEAISNTNAIVAGDLPVYNGVDKERIWVRVTDNSNPLSFGVTSFYLHRYRLPLIQQNLLPITACENGSTGLANFDLNLAYNLIPINQVGVSLEFYLNQSDALLGNTALMLPANYTGAAGTIYVRVRNLDGDCFVVVPQQLQIINTPTANQVGPITICDLYNTGFGEFNLDPYKVLIAGNPMPANSVVTFHETQGDADANVNAIQTPGAYTNKVKDQHIIYARVGFTNSSCYNTVAITLRVNKTPAITPISRLVVCDLNNDGVETFNLRVKESEMLQGLNATNYTITYHTSGANAMSGTGAIGNTASFSSTIATVVYARVTDNTTGCYAVNEIDLVISPMPVVATPLPTVTKCDGDGNGFEIFDLASLIPTITGTQQGLGVTYHYTNADAQAGTSPLALQYQNVVAGAQTIYVRVYNQSTDCYVITTLKLEVKANPVINMPTTPYAICSNSGYGTINLYLYGKDLVDASGHNYIFHFYETQADAMSDVGAIQNVISYNNIDPNNPILWIRFEDPITGCFSVYPISFQLVTPPKLPTSLPELATCDVTGDVFDVTTVFDLTQQTAALLAAQTVQGTFQVRYFTSQPSAQSNSNWIVDPTQFVNTSSPQTIWVRIEDVSKAGGCSSIMSFTIRVNSPLRLNQPSPIIKCDTTLPNDGKMMFDLTVREAFILGTQPFQTTVTYHVDKQDAENGWNNISDPKKFYNTSNPQTVYASVINQYGCRSVIGLTVRVLPLPEPNLKPLPLEMCEDAPGSLQANFDLTLAQPNLGGTLNYEYSYYTSAVDAELGNGNTRIAAPEAFLSGNNTIYVRVTNSFTDVTDKCAVVVPLELKVNSLPLIGPMTPLPACMENPTKTTKFNLRDKDSEALAGQDPANFSVVYYTSEDNAIDGLNPIPYVFTNTTDDRQTIWVRVENKETGCFSVASFLIQIEPKVYAYIPSQTQFCETDYENDGESVIDLTSMDVEIIGNQPLGADLLVRYTRVDGTPVVDPTQAQFKSGDIVIAIVYNRDNEIYCTAAVQFHISLKPAPEVLALKDGVICYDYRREGDIITGHYLETGVSLTADYTFTWTRNGQPLAPEHADVLDGGRRLYVRVEGTYEVTVESNVNGCVTKRTATIEQGPSITIDEVVMTDSFGDANAIEVIAISNSSPLEYKLDEGNWQDSNIFLDVAPGEHIVYVRGKDTISCPLSKVITVMDYPKYFTPNNDGYHDTWNIWSLKNQPQSKIYIFDRFGQLLKQLSPAGEGWNGTFNGKDLPSTDYWFKAEYIDPKTGLQKEVTGHFSLKR